jgi:hypothetical protein
VERREGKSLVSLERVYRASDGDGISHCTRKLWEIEAMCNLTLDFSRVMLRKNLRNLLGRASVRGMNIKFVLRNGSIASG